MCKMKSTARCQQTVAASSSSSKDDLSLGANQEETLALTCDATSSSMVLERRSVVISI
jgi:Flp pilus assembly protein TadD